MPTVKKLPVPRNAVVHNVMTLNMWANDIQAWAIEKGWSTADLPDVPEQVRQIIVEKLLMTITEVAEAAEAVRDVDFTHPEYLRPLQRSFIAKSSKPEGLPSELIDVLIRVLHLCAFLGIDVEHEMTLKMTYNNSRGHRHGGKSL